MTRLAVDVVGSGPDVVLIHGWGLHGGLWSRIVEQWAGAFRLHIVDLPGHGNSRESALPDARLDAWAQRVLENVPPRAAWVGWSLGGLIALAAAASSPAAVARLVLVATTPRFVAAADWPHGMAEETFRQFARDLETDYQQTLLRFLSLQTGSGEAGRETLRQMRTRLAERPAPSVPALRSGLALLEAGDLRSVGAALEAPTLVVHGTRDRLALPAAAQAFAESTPHVHLSWVEGAGHAPMISHPAEVAGRVASWLSRGAA